MTDGLKTIDGLARALAEGRTSSRRLTESCLDRIEDPHGEGRRTFIEVNRTAALEVADNMDRLRLANTAPSVYAGIPISIKDLFDVRGERTRAGSLVLADSEPATRDAESVARLRRAGFVLIGRTNMTEFAYSGLGLNPHYGTPRNPWQREKSRIPGGSTSGGAVSVADRMAHAALGTDTGGSCRIPAAFCGLVGFKPTARRVSRDGVIPLSTSLDSVGSLGRTVECCAALDSILSDEPLPRLTDTKVGGLRLGVVRTLVQDGMDDHVLHAIERTLSELSKSGAELRELDVPALNDIAHINAKGGFPAAEGFYWHRKLLKKHASIYDPRVLARLRRGAEQTAADYIELIELRGNLISAVASVAMSVDALIFPTVPIVPPLIAELQHDNDFAKFNLLVLRNSTMVNMIDGCGISIPVNEPGEAPVGLTIAGLSGTDHSILRYAAAIERCLRSAKGLPLP